MSGQPSSARSGAARRVAFQGERGAFSEEAAVRLLGEEALALRERDRVRLDGLDLFERGAGAADEEVTDGDDDLRGDAERAVEQQVVRAVDGAGERVLGGREREVGRALFRSGEERLEGRARDERHALAQELHGRLLAEGPALALEGDARRAAPFAHLAASCGCAAS